MNDQHNINNNQNTYRSSERSDSYSSNTRAAEPNTRVLSDDERRDFDGVTIEEVGDSVHVDSTPTYMDEERQRYEQYNQYGPQVKVYSFNSTSWLSRIILIIILAVVLAAVVFFGGIILSVVGVVILVGAIVSFIFGLF
ncbi:DUF4229 domain-containing protein [uncultured Veillonella sp.]|uniref:DUF4229 domain-containing protein n=1 Tax=uncultured Veillonella sp. TaxID=159268 RepID=UPI0028DBBE47|nr:DUF4229 domain-containing protein [uncultured Veillonella sp.]